MATGSVISGNTGREYKSKLRMRFPQHYGNGVQYTCSMRTWSIDRDSYGDESTFSTGEWDAGVTFNVLVKSVAQQQKMVVKIGGGDSFYNGMDLTIDQTPQLYTGQRASECPRSITPACLTTRHPMLIILKSQH